MKGLRELLLVMAVLHPWQAEAATADLQGKIVDENALPVSGAEVVLKSPEGKTQTVHSDPTGAFEIRSLISGEYTVSLAAVGFFRLADQPLHLGEGKNSASFTMNHELQLHENIEVTASSAEIQPEQPAHVETLQPQDIVDIPTNRTHDLNSTLPALPGVVQDPSGGLHVGGARPEQTEYLLNGFEIGDPATGQLTSRLNTDSVNSLNIATGSYGAEFAHAGTSVLQLDTLTGDDQWRFGTTNFFPGISVKQGVNLGNWYPRFTFSGPIEKSRAWFSDSLSFQHTFAVTSGLPRNADTVTQWSADNLLRAQVNISPSNVLQVDFLVNAARDTNLGLSPFSPISTTRNLHAARAFASFKDQITLSGSLLEVGFAVDRGTMDALPHGSAPYEIIPSLAIFAGNYFERLHQQTQREQLVADWIKPSLHWRGVHDVKIGLNGDRVGLDQQAFRTSQETLAADLTTIVHEASFVGPAAYSVFNYQAGFYAQDAWRALPHLIVHAGIRTDWDQIVHAALAEPRLAATWLPFRNETAKLTVGWGVYYQPIPLALWGQGLDQERIDLFNVISSTPNTVVTRFLPPSEDLRQPRFHTATFEWEQKIGSNTVIGVHAIRRDQALGLAYELVPEGLSLNTIMLANDRRDRYRAADFYLRHTFHNAAEVFADYTRSSARSNQVLDYSLATPYFAPQAAGPLSWDTPNRFLSWGWLPISFQSLLLSYELETRTGFPFSLVNQQQQLIGLPNQSRFPSYFSLNLGIEKRFHFRNHEWAVRGVVVNATNHLNPNAVSNISGGPPLFGGGQGRAFTARLRLVGHK